MATANLSMMITAKDAASAVFNRTSASMDRVGRSSRTTTKAAGQQATVMSRLDKTVRRAATGFAAFYVGRKAIDFFKASISGAAATEEALNGINVMFGKSGRAMQQWSTTTAREFGQSQTESLKAAVGFGQIGKAAGLSRREMVPFSQNLVALASDMASFSDTSPQQAIEAMTSAFAGQVKPLRQYKVFLDAAALKHEAVKMGIDDGVGALTQEQRILAVNSLLWKKTAQQQGDFARTLGGSLPNQIRKVSALWSDLQDEFGATITPIALDVMKDLADALPGIQSAISRNAPQIKEFFRGIVDGAMNIAKIAGPILKEIGGLIGKAYSAFASLPPGVQDAAIKITAVAIAFGKVKSVIATLGLAKAATGLFALGKAGRSAAAGIGLSATIGAGMNKALGANAGLAGAAATKTGAFGKSAGRAAGALGAMVPAMAGFSAATLGIGAAVSAAVVGLMSYQIHMGNVAARGDELSSTFDQVTGKATELSHINLGENFLKDFDAGALEQTPFTLDEITSAAMQGGQAMTDLRAKLAAWKDTLPFWEKSGLGWATALTNSINAAERDAQAARETAEAHQYAKDQITGTRQAQEKYTEAVNNYQAARQKSLQAQAQVNSQTGAFTAKSRLAREAIREEGQATKSALAAYRDLGKSKSQVASRTASARAAFLESAKAMGIGLQAARKLARQYGLVPSKVKTKVDAPGADSARKKLERFTKAGQAPPKTAKTKVDSPGADAARKKLERFTKAGQAPPKTAKTKVDAPGADNSTGKLNKTTAAAKNLDRQSPHVTASVNTGSALSNLNSLKYALDAFNGRVFTATAKVVRVGGSVNALATGGLVRGPGTSTSDSIPAMLSDGEHVTRAASVKKYGTRLFHRLNAGVIDPAQVQHLAKGGRVKREKKSQAASGFNADQLAWINAGNPFPQMRPDILGKKPPKSRARFRKRHGKVKGDRLYEKWLRGWENRQQLKAARKQWRQDAKAEATQKRQDAKAEADRKAEEAKAERDRKTEERNQAIREAMAAQESRTEQARSKIGQGLAAARSFGSVTGFDLGAAATTRDAWQQSLRQVAGSGSANDRAKAIKDAKEAQLKAAQAAVTPGNVTRWMADKLKTMTAFNNVLGGLRKKGLHPVTLAEVASMSPEDGLAMGKALMGADLRWINGIQNSIDAQAGRYGFDQFTRDTKADQYTSDLTDRILKNQTVNNQPMQLDVDLYLDGQIIDASLVRLKQRRATP